MASEADTTPVTYREVFGKEVEWKPEAPVTFWFARHGVSEYNLEDRIGGDSNLTPAGQVFADILPSLFGQVLQESGDDHRFISVWTSTLLRTIQTASKLPLPQVHLKELDEINAGVCDGATYEYIKRYMPYIHYNRKKDKLGYRYPSGESYIDLCKRVWPIVRQLKAHGGSKLIVGHQAVLRCIFGYLEGKPLKDITHLSVPHHAIFQFTVYPDGKIIRKDFHMDKVRDPANPSKPVPSWPFDVSHSRPLTATDIARYSPKPKVPLLINRVASLSDVPPVGSATLDPIGEGVPPPALPPLLSDAVTCAAFVEKQVCSSSSGATTVTTAPVAICGKRAADVSTGTDAESQQLHRTKTSRVKSKNGSCDGSSAMQCAGMDGDERRLLSSKSQTVATARGAPVLGGNSDRDPEGLQRMKSAPGDILRCMGTFQQSPQPDTLEELDDDPSTASAHASAAEEGKLSHETPLGMSLERDAPSHMHTHSAPCLPEHRSDSAACSIPEKCGALLASTHNSEFHIRSHPGAIDSKAPAPRLPSAETSFASSFAPCSLCLQQHPASGTCSRTRSTDTVSTFPPQSKHNSTPKTLADAAQNSKQHPTINPNPNSSQTFPMPQNIPPEVRCMACGAMVPVPQSRPCDIKPTRWNSGNVQNVLMSYLPEGVSSSVTLSSYANDSCSNSKRESYNIGSAFDFDDALPQIPQPLPPGAGLENLPEASNSQLQGAGFSTGSTAITTVLSGPGTATPPIGTISAAATPSTTSPPFAEAPPATAEPSSLRNEASSSGLGVRTPQLELREANIPTGLTPLDMGSGDPGAEYPGSPCAPYPLIATPKHLRTMSELALAFQELRTRGSCSHNGSGVGSAAEGVAGSSSFSEGGVMGSRTGTGRLSMTPGVHGVHASADSFVTDDPCVRAEELRRKLEISQGFHFRGEVCRLVESGLRDSQPVHEEPMHDPHMHQPADLAW